MQSFLCTKANGKMKIYDRSGLDRALEQFGDGEDFELTIGEVEKGHTRKQEKFFHGPVLKAFIATGLGKQEAKDMLALRFIPQEIRLMDGSVAVVPGHTSSLKKEEYTAFIESCIQLAAENDLYIEDADTWLAKNRRAA